MYARLLPTPTKSTLLFGPRGTGKSTWIQSRFPQAVVYDLLETSESLRLNADPGALYNECQSLPANSWVVIDEVQRAPMLLDHVHRLIEGNAINFVLSGSSARKLRRGGRNLLAGRARTCELFPLVSAEMQGDASIERRMRFGSLPTAITNDDPENYLRSYAETYLDQEIRAEALVQNFAGFARFLEVAAHQNAETTNASAISRDAGVARSTVTGYFDLLVDTLIGYWLKPWKLKSSNKQVQHSKLYLFDCGVARALSGRLPFPPSQEEKGALLETLVAGEVRAHLSYSGKHYPCHYWRNYQGTEVDLLVETQDGFAAVEVKANARWERRFNRGLHRVSEDIGKEKVRRYGVYLGQRSALVDDVLVLPVESFLERVWDGEIYP